MRSCMLLAQSSECQEQHMTTGSSPGDSRHHALLKLQCCRQGHKCLTLRHRSVAERSRGLC